MRSIYKIMIVAAVAALLFSCDREKLLGITPYGKVVPTTYEEYDLMFNTTSNYNMYHIDVYMSDELVVKPGDFSEYNPWGSYSRVADAMMWKKLHGTNVDKDYNWENLYKILNVYNLVKDATEMSTISGSDDLRNKLRAEALVRRAYTYWAMANIYGKQYNEKTSENDLAVPLTLSSEFVESMPRATVKQIYDQVLADLNEALSLKTLPEAPSAHNHRVTKTGALAVLAKVYLQMGKFEDALNASNECLQLYSVLTDYKNIDLMPYLWDNREIIMLAGVKDINDIAYGAPMHVNSDIIKLYSSDDKRLNLLYVANSNIEDVAAGYSHGLNIYDYDVWSNTTHNIGPTVGEMLLIRAECNARVGELSNVSEDLNTLRAMRINNYTGIDVFIDKAVALNEVKEERLRELTGKGVRLFDLKRYNAYDNANISLERTIEGEVYQLPANDNRWIVPIAESLITFDPALVQSPR